MKRFSVIIIAFAATLLPLAPAARASDALVPQAPLSVLLAPLADTRVTLTRFRSRGGVPVYSVTVTGTGEVRFIGLGYGAIPGEHNYRISPADAATLVAAVQKADLWSLRDRYVSGGISDGPGASIGIVAGGRSKIVYEYYGENAGMPQDALALEDLIDATTQSADWSRVNGKTLDRLRGEGFDFTSQAAADLLADAIGDYDQDNDAALIALIDAGAPLGASKNLGATGDNRTMDFLEQAIVFHRTAIAEALLTKDVLKTNGVIDRTRLDWDFREAVAQADLKIVEALLPLQPSLTFQDTSELAPRTLPVTVLFDANPIDAHWQGFAVTRLLLDRGCDINAADSQGRTLLHVATQMEKVDMVRYLIAHGAQVDAVDATGDAALDMAWNEDIAIALLEAGADPNIRRNDDSFAERAQRDRMTRVLAWQAAHPAKS